jgi:hypothetical protein
MPISYDGRSYAEGKKIGWKDGVSALWCIWKYNVFPPRVERWKAPKVAPWDAPERIAEVREKARVASPQEP